MHIKNTFVSHTNHQILTHIKQRHVHFVIDNELRHGQEILLVSTDADQRANTLFCWLSGSTTLTLLSVQCTHTSSLILSFYVPWTALCQGQGVTLFDSCIATRAHSCRRGKQQPSLNLDDMGRILFSDLTINNLQTGQFTASVILQHH